MDSNSQKNGNGDDGMTYGNLIISVVFSVVLIFVISISLYLFKKNSDEWHLLMDKKDTDYANRFHEHQEDAAYQFTWIKNQLNQMQNICREKDNLIEQHMAFEQRYVAKEPPVQLLSKGGECLVEKEVPKRPKPTEDK